MMPAAFGAWGFLGGKWCPSDYQSSPFDDDSKVQRFSSKYKHGKRVERRELVEKFKGLAVTDIQGDMSRARPCGYNEWECFMIRKLGNKGFEDLMDDFFWRDWQRVCKLADGDFEEDGESDDDEEDDYDALGVPFCHTHGGSVSQCTPKGVFTINRKACQVRARVIVRHDPKESHSRRHPTSKVKRRAAKRDARDAVRDFKSLE